VYYQTNSLQMAVALAEALLATLLTRPANPLLTTPTVHLYTAATNPPSPQSAVADFTEATFAGYAAVVLASLVGPVLLPSSEGYGLIGHADFIGGAVVSPGQVIIGYWIDDGTATFYAGEAFQNPIPISVPGDFISLDAVFPIITPAQAN
jgi:hypothetical protein